MVCVMVFVSFGFFPMFIFVSELSPTAFYIICILGSLSFLTGVMFMLLKRTELALFSIIFLQWFEEWPVCLMMSSVIYEALSVQCIYTLSTVTKFRAPFYYNLTKLNIAYSFLTTPWTTIRANKQKIWQPISR